MLRFVGLPHLPEGEVRHILIGEQYIPYFDLEKHGIIAIPLGKIDELDPAIAEHADMQAIHLGRNMYMINHGSAREVEKLYQDIVLSDNCNVNQLDSNFTPIEGPVIQTDRYPGCAAYNVLILGDKVFYNPRSAGVQIIERTQEVGYHHIAVNQGFTRCSACIVDENSVITADAGMYRAFRDNGVDALLIEPGYIDLLGYRYGFIGGATCKLSKNKLAFTGTYDHHPDFMEINRFLIQRGVEPVVLSGRKIFDIGSAVLLTEEKK